MNHLDLFSGIGGFALAAKWCGMTTVGFSEIEPYANLILQKFWPNIPNLGNIKNIVEIKNKIDIITGGFPCQPFSVAGKKKSKGDDRYLWPEMFRVIKLCKPAWVLGENVAHIEKLALDDILADLENEGYSCRAFNIPACAVEACPQRRERIWIIANLDGVRCDKRKHCRCQRYLQEYEKWDVTQVYSGGSQFESKSWKTDPDSNWKTYKSLCRRMADGIPNRVDRIKALGNAIVPKVAFQIMKCISILESI